MNNAEWVIYNGYKLKDILFYKNYTDDESWDYRIEISKANLNEHVKGADRADALLRWLAAEHIEPILDDAEKRYLSAIIKPFRDDVQFIMKYKGCFSSKVYEEIAVWYRDKIDGEKNYCMLPKFEKGTMYKNMEVSRHYTLEELGL